MSNPTRISPSRLRTFNECPKKFEFQYIQELPTTDKDYFECGRKVEEILYLLIRGEEAPKNYEWKLAKAIYENKDFRKLIDWKELKFQNEVKTDDFIGYTDIETDTDVIDIKTSSASITAETAKDYKWQAKGYFKHTGKPVTFVIVNKNNQNVQVIKMIPKDLNDYEEKILELRLAVELGIMNPKTGFHCKFCDFSSLCPWYTSTSK